MTLRQQRDVECPNCGHHQNATMWASVNVTQNPELRNRILERDLTAFHCEECAYSAELAYDMLYHDMERRLLVWLVPNGEMPDDDASGVFGKLGDLGGNPYRLRIVDSMNGLIEKVRTEEAGLDDRVVEVLKALLLRHMGDTAREHGGELFFSEIESPAEGGQVIRFALVADESVSSVTAAWQWLVRVQERCGEFLPTRDDERESWLRVNQEYVRTVLEPFGGADGPAFPPPDPDNG
jgi:hypothetical protein